MELLTNATVVDDAITFVTANNNNKKAVARASCGIDIKANQSNNVHAFNAMDDELQEQQQRQTAVRLHVRLIRFSDEDLVSNLAFNEAMISV